MNKNVFVVYAVALSGLSFALAVALAGFARELRSAMHAMVGDVPLPWATTIGLSCPPIFHILGVLFLSLAGAALARPSWITGLVHALILTLVGEAIAIFICVGGAASFFTALDYGMQQ